MAGLLAGCERESRPGSKAARDLQGSVIAVIGSSEADPHWLGIRGGVQRCAARLPILRVHCVTPPESTPDGLVAAVKEALKLQPRVICLYVTDPDAARPAAAEIVAQHVLLITMGQRCGDAPVSGHVGVDLTAAAELLGDNLERIAADRQSYLLLHEAGRGELATYCYQRFMEKARRQFNVRLLAEATAADSTGRGEQLLEEMLRRYPRAGLVVTLNADLWLHPPAGWEQDARAVNPEFRFATLAAVPTLWPRLGRSGTEGQAAALVGPLDGDIGFAAVAAAADALLHQTQTVQRTIPCELVTPENLADFARRYSEAAGGLDVSAYLPANATPTDGG